MSFLCEHWGENPFEVCIAPFLPLGSEVVDVKIDGLQSEFNIHSSHDYYQCEVKTTLEQRKAIEIVFNPGVAILPPLNNVQIGDPPRELKIIHHTYIDNEHTITVEGLAHKNYELVLLCDKKITSITGAEVLQTSARTVTLSIDFSGSLKGYIRKKIRFKTG